MLVFIDNEAARAGLVRGSSACPASGLLIEAVVDRDLRDHALMWYARVPSASNLADAPSRGQAPEHLPGWSKPVLREVSFDCAPSGP